MLRISIALVGLVALDGVAQGQQTISSKVKPITGTVRDAGIFHCGSSTWTRKASQASIGADIIYNNTVPAPSFTLWPLSGDTYVDEGRLPSPTSPSNLISRPGCALSYTIDGVQFAYCTDEPAGGAFTLSFFELYTACATTVALIPQGSITTPGPGSPIVGIQACWLVTMDLDTPPTSFVLQADGDGTYASPEGTNLFGWEISSTLPSGAQLGTGPLAAGDPTFATRYDGTRWDTPVNYAEDGTGMGTLDMFRIDFGPTTPGCYWFGSIPFASFFLRLYADACGCTSPGVVFCCGNGTGTLCPCGNHSSFLVAGTCSGCLNSLGLVVGGRLGAGGLGCQGPQLVAGGASISNDTVVLIGTDMPNSSALYFQGTTQNGTPPGAGTIFGDGKRCAGGTVIRLGTKTNVLGASSYPTGLDLSISVKGIVTTPGTRTYQVWYRNAAAFCTSSTFNLTNGYQITWGT